MMRLIDDKPKIVSEKTKPEETRQLCQTRDHSDRGNWLCSAGREGADLGGLDGRKGGRSSEEIGKGGDTGGSDGIGDFANAGSGESQRQHTFIQHSIHLNFLMQTNKKYVIMKTLDSINH